VLGVRVESRHDREKRFKTRFNEMTPRLILVSGEEYVHCNLACERSFLLLGFCISICFMFSILVSMV